MKFKKEVKPELGAISVSERLVDNLPFMTINSKVLPDLVDMRVDDTVDLLGKFKVKSLRRVKGENDKSDVVADMEMISCEVKDASPDYKESKRMGLDRESFNEYKIKKEKKGA